MYPPRPRGWTRRAEVPRQADAVSPASAGMDPSGLLCLRIVSSIPRVRGDGPGKAYYRGAFHLYPPRPRGWTLESQLKKKSRNVSPASAGMDPFAQRDVRVSDCIPRVRGDGPTLCLGDLDCFEYPPRPRGWTRSIHCRKCCRSVSPASAGMDPGRSATRISHTSIPRVRGDGPVVDEARRRAAEYPPRPRGWTRMRSYP